MNMENHTLGSYRIECKLGEGGMGAVYRATQMRLERTVALKVISTAHTANPEITIRFLREGQTIAALDHPNILPVYEAGEAHLDTGEGPFSYLAMRYVAGGTLRDLIIREGKLKPSRALYLLEQAAAGLQVAHNHGYIHRDIKPANLLLDPAVPGQRGEHLSIADFGIVKTTSDADTFKTSTGAVIGTPTYMAPEQLQGMPVDSRADIYALTIVLYEMLKGEVPFKAETPAMVMVRKMSEPPPPFNAAALGLSPAIDAVIARGLAMQPDQRFATPMELVETFRQALAAPATAVVQTADTQWAAHQAANGHNAVTAASPVTPLPSQAQSAAGQPTIGATTHPDTPPAHQTHPPHQTNPTLPPATTTQLNQPMPIAYVIGMVVLGVVVILLAGALVFTQLGEDHDEAEEHNAPAAALDPTAQTTAQDAVGVLPSSPAEPEPGSPAEPTPPPPPPTSEPPPPTEPGADNTEPPDSPRSRELPPPIDAAQLDTLFESAEGDYGTVIYDVDNQTRLYEVDADRRFQTNSLIRLPIAVTAYALAGDEQGEFTLDNEVKLEQADIVDGPGTIQNDPPGTAYTVRDLCRRMIAESDDTAAAMLIRSIGGFDRVNAQMQALGATETKMHGFITERENQTIPDDMVLLLQKLAGGDIASGEEIVRAMEQSQSDDRIRTGLPPASNVASITSTFEGGVHRVMLIETPTAHRFILVVLSKDVPDTETFTETIAEAAALVFMSGGPPGHTSAPPTSQPQNGGEDTPDDPSAPSVPPDGGGVPDAPSAPPAPPDGTPEGPGVRPTPPDGMPLPPDGAPPPNGPPPNGPPPDGPPPPNGAPPRPDSP